MTQRTLNFVQVPRRHRNKTQQHPQLTIM